MTATIHKLTAGDGYLYYVRQVAAHDSTDKGRDSLADYYSTRGESPGRWAGSGLAALGIAPGSTVSEAQMKALFGEGKHPNAALLEQHAYAQARAAGIDPQPARDAALAATWLGNPFKIYSGATEFQIACAQAYGAHNAANGADRRDRLADDVRARIRTDVATTMFTGQYGRAPLDGRELSGWAAANSRQLTTAVAGWDFTFSPVKSVSTLWAIAPKPVAEKILQAHRVAVDDALGYLEGHATFTRLGRNGIRQVNVDGLVIALFEHRESRAGDPDLHTHAVASAKVRTADGRWRAVDGRMFYQHLVVASEVYNTRLEQHLERLLGLVFGERPGTEPGKRAIREIVGVAPGLNEHWSKRAAAIVAHQADLEAAFQALHGRDPLPGEVYELAEQATLDTRSAKHDTRPEHVQRRDWFADAAGLLGGPQQVIDMIADALTRAAPVRAVVDDAWIARAARDVVDIVSSERATWRITHVRAETQRRIRGAIPPDRWAEITEAVVDAALAPTRSVPRGDPDLRAEPDLARTPDWLRRRDGSDMHTVAGSARYSSAPILSAESRLLAAAELGGARVLDDATITAAIDTYHADNPDKTLNAGQLAVIREFATSARRLQLCTAPAGTGKTTAMGVLADAWTAAGGRVVGFAPTAAAAAVLHHDLGAGIPVATFDTLTHTLAEHTPNLDDLIYGDERFLPAEIADWIADIGPDTLVIVDEFAKLDTRKLDAGFTRFLLPRGATIRGIGDPAQLAAIGPGGIATDITDLTPTPTLSHVVRFADAAERAASLALRAGDPVALGFYLDHRRLHSGTPATTAIDAYTAWTSDHHAGCDTIMLAPTRAMVTELNARARADRLSRSHTSEGPRVQLADRLHASVGDTICTRRNRKKLRFGDNDFVRNGYRWIVTDVRDDGRITARHLLPGRQLGDTVTLPAVYLRRHVTLGYASTIDSAQGITVDTCHGVLSGHESRNQLYVLLTRGRAANHAYVTTTIDGAEQTIYTDVATHPATIVDILTRILGRDGAQHSATTELRDALDPHLRLGAAVDTYLDTLGQTIEHTAGPEVLTAIDHAAGRTVPFLTDSPAYPILRQQLACLAIDGTDPAQALRDAAAVRELGSADDPAAVLHWRLTRRHPELGDTDGPLPWLPGIPATLTDANYSDARYLRARARIVAGLADRIRTETQFTPTTSAPAWARPLAGIDPDLLADLAVWRAANHIQSADPHPTGADRYVALEREYQQLLDARVTAAVGDTNLAVHTWAHTVKALDDRITTDPTWPILAAALDTAHHAGLDPETRLHTAVAEGPLPAEMPAAALLYRLTLDPGALHTNRADSLLRPDWLPGLHAAVGDELARRITASATWPTLVAAVDDHTLGSDWTPHDLIATAFELLAAHLDDGPAMRADQLVTALAWRVELLQQQPPTIQLPDSGVASEAAAPQPPEHGTGTDPVGDRDAVAADATPDREDQPDSHSTDWTDTAAGSPDPRFARAAAFVAADDLQAARREIGDIYTALSDEERDIADTVAVVLERFPFERALHRLRGLWRDQPHHRPLLTALVPRTDPRLYRPPLPEPADHDGLRIPRTSRGIRHTDDLRTRTDLTRRTDPDDRTPQPPEPETVTAYFTTRHGIDDQPEHSPPAPGYELDYDHAAVPEPHGTPCVSCWIERPSIDREPQPGRHSDDGLCSDCRDHHRPAIPDLPPGHARPEFIAARATYIRDHHPHAATNLLREWWRNSDPDTRALLADWIHDHPALDTAESAPRPSAAPTLAPPQRRPPEPDTALTPPAVALTTPVHWLDDTSLAAAITGLQRRIATARAGGSAVTALRTVAPKTTNRTTRSDETSQAITTAITTARRTRTAADRTAADLAGIDTELTTLRTELAATPRLNRRARARLREAIDTTTNRRTAAQSQHHRTHHAALRAEQDATRLAGPPQEWDRILTDEQQRTPSPQDPPAPDFAVDETVAARDIARLEHQLGEHITEQQRRRGLSAARRRAEQQLRHQRPRQAGQPSPLAPAHADAERDRGDGVEM